MTTTAVQSVINNIAYSKQVVELNVRSKHSRSMNEWADFIRYKLGVNCIPADTRTKLPALQSYKEWLNKPIPDELHEKWKSEGKFNNGIALMCGKVWHNWVKKGLYLNCVDCDNQKAIDEFLQMNGHAAITLELLSKTMIVEQHEDDRTKAHIYFYSHTPLRKKNSDIAKLKKAGVNVEIPIFEVKGEGKHGIMYCCPSIHKNGFPYRILGTMEPAIYDDVQQHIDRICQKYRLNSSGEEQHNPSTSIETLKFCKGERNTEFHKHIHDMIYTNWDKMTRDVMKSLALLYNKTMCYDETGTTLDPLPEQEVLNTFNSAYNDVAKTKNKQSQIENEVVGQIKELVPEPEQTEEVEDSLDKLINLYHFKTLNDTQEVWYYNKKTGNFVPNGEIIIKKFFETGGKKQGKPLGSILTEIEQNIKILQIRTNIDRKKFNPSIEWLATENCMLNVRTGETKPFSPDFMNTTAIPVTYTPEAKCPEIMKFLKQGMSDQDIEIVLDFIAYCLWREYKFASWLLLNGEGNNGKGTLIRLIENFLGEGNYSAVSLDSLLNRVFSTAKLYSKLANFDADLKPSAFIKSGTDRIKILTGNDSLEVENKFSKQFTMRNYAKLIMSCNKVPETPDTTTAFFKRMIIVNFKKEFYGDDDDVDLINKISTEEELSGLLNECLRRLPDVLKRAIRKLTKETLEGSIEKYNMSLDPVQFFINKELYHTEKEEDRISVQEMLEYYEKFRNENSLTTKSEQSLRTRLKSEGYSVKRFRVHYERAYYWYKVKKREKELEDDE